MRRRPPAIAAGEGLTLPDRPRPDPAGYETDEVCVVAVWAYA